MSDVGSTRHVVVRGTEILESDARHERLPKLARIALDEMAPQVGLLSTDGTLLEHSRAALAGGAWSRADALGKPLWEVLGWAGTPEAQEALRSAIARAAGGEEVRYDAAVPAGETAGASASETAGESAPAGAGAGADVSASAGAGAEPHAAAETRTLDVSLRPVRDESGDVAFLLYEARDITAQRRLERERERMDLELQSLREAAVSASRAKDEFLAILGHELRNPLAPIVTALQLLRLRGAADTASSERARAVIERQVSHLTRLVDDLLDVTRIVRGKAELKQKLTEIAEIVRDALEPAGPLFEQRQHTLTLEVPRRGLRVSGDPMRLGQVVSNLLTNAAKYTPPGGRVTVRAEREGGEVVLRVRDTGAGIAPELLPRIFDLFVQGRQPLDRSQGGLGLGLTIVRSLVELHGGSVAAYSEGPGRGSELVVRLPAADTSDAADARDAANAAAATGRAGQPATGSPSGVRILVVDDNEDAAITLAEILAEKGYDTRVAHDAPAALRVAAELAPDLAVLDIGLPVMDGYELATHLRALPGLAGIYLIALTGYGQESDRQQALRAGFHHHLVKPVGIDAIGAVVRDALASRYPTPPGQ